MLNQNKQRWDLFSKRLLNRRAVAERHFFRSFLDFQRYGCALWQCKEILSELLPNFLQFLSKSALLIFDYLFLIGRGFGGTPPFHWCDKLIQEKIWSNFIYQSSLVVNFGSCLGPRTKLTMPRRPFLKKTWKWTDTWKKSWNRYTWDTLSPYNMTLMTE